MFIIMLAGESACLRITCIAVGLASGGLVGESAAGRRGGSSACGLLGSLNESGMPAGGFGSVVIPGTLSTCSNDDHIHCGRFGVFATM
ncbi:hypothetical protein ACVI1J_002924 [Bradyrhizobium diazoefficiens]